MTHIASPSSIATGRPSQKTRSDPASALWGEILAPFEPWRREFMARASPTCRVIFWRWSSAAGLDGLSAKMFVHLMWSSLRADWTCSDTQTWFSRRTQRRLRVRCDAVSGWWDSISREPLIGSSEHALTPKAVTGLARRWCIRRNLGWGNSLRVLLRDGTAWTLAMCSFTKGLNGDFACSVMKSGNASRDGPRAGLEAYLTRLANGWSETERSRPSPNGSD